MKNGKLVIVGGENTMLVIHLSSFSYIDVDEVEGTSFHALFVDNFVVESICESISSLKDVQHSLKNGQSAKGE